MTLREITLAAGAAALAAALALSPAAGARAQDKPHPGGRTAVLNFRDCMDRSQNVRIAQIEAEVQKAQDAESGRATDLNPQERARIRTKILDLHNLRRLEIYQEIVRTSGEVAQAHGFDLVERFERVPALDSGDAEFAGKLERRDVVYADPGVDITREVLERINRAHAAPPK